MEEYGWIEIVQVLIPVVAPMLISALRKFFASLDGSGALVGNLILNLIAQIATALITGGDPMAATAMGGVGAAFGTGANQYVRKARKAVVLRQPRSS